LKHSEDPRRRSYIINPINGRFSLESVLAADLPSLLKQAEDWRRESYIIRLSDRRVRELIFKPPLAYDVGRAYPPGPSRDRAILFDPWTSTLRARILATELSSGRFRDFSNDPLVDLLLRHPDAGVHGAAEWVLREAARSEGDFRKRMNGGGLTGELE